MLRIYSPGMNNNLSGKFQGGNPSPGHDGLSLDQAVKGKLMTYVFTFLHSKAGPTAGYIVGFFVSLLLVKAANLGIEILPEDQDKLVAGLTAVLAGALNYGIHWLQNRNAVKIQEEIGAPVKDGWLGTDSQARAAEVAFYASVPKAIPVREGETE